jgi:hypothetical protein
MGGPVGQSRRLRGLPSSITPLERSPARLLASEMIRTTPGFCDEKLWASIERSPVPVGELKTPLVNHSWRAPLGSPARRPHTCRFLTKAQLGQLPAPPVPPKSGVSFLSGGSIPLTPRATQASNYAALRFSLSPFPSPCSATAPDSMLQSCSPCMQCLGLWWWCTRCRADSIVSIACLLPSARHEMGLWLASFVFFARRHVCFTRQAPACSLQLLLELDSRDPRNMPLVACLSFWCKGRLPLACFAIRSSA